MWLSSWFLTVLSNLLPLCCSYGIVHCKHQAALLFCGVFWRLHRSSRPDWAKIRARVVLTQRDRVILGRNLDWRDALLATTQPYASGMRFYTEEAGLVAEPPAPQPRAPAQKKKPVKKQKRISSESTDSDEEATAPPPKRQRQERHPGLEAKFDELRELAKGENTNTMKAWLRRLYPEYADNISCTSKHQTLYILASLLLSKNC